MMSAANSLKGVFPTEKRTNGGRNFVMENIQSVQKLKKPAANSKLAVRPQSRFAAFSGDCAKSQKDKSSQTAISSALLNNDESLLLSLLKKCSIEQAVQTEDFECTKSCDPDGANRNKESQKELRSPREHNKNHTVPRHYSGQHNHEMVNEKQTQLVRDDEKLEKQLSYEYRPGWYFVPENEKQKRLEKLQKEFHNCLDEMNRLPFFSTTLRVHNRKMELEKKLGEIENEIRFFSKTKVFIKIDNESEN